MGVIQIHDISKTYKSGRASVQALRGLHLIIGAGEMVALTGPHGAGKSTLLNIIACLDTPTSGMYLLDGQYATGLLPDEMADMRNQHLGIVTRGTDLLWHLSLLENVALPLRYNRSGRRRDVVGLATRALARVGLADRLHTDLRDLSNAEQQRAAVARALATGATLLLADEPTACLDRHGSVEIMSLLKSLNDQGVTVVFATDDAAIAAHAKRIVTMREGCIYSDVLRTNGERHERAGAA